MLSILNTYQNHQQQTQNLKPALFETGEICVTLGLFDWAEQHLPNDLLANNLWCHILLDAHTRGCWDSMSTHDKEANLFAVSSKQTRIFSSFEIIDTKIWVITEWDRSVTTLLLPDEY